MPQLKINYIGNKLAVSKLFFGEVLEAVVILAVTFDDDYAHGISLPPAFLCHITKSLFTLQGSKFKNQSNCCPPTFYLDLHQDVTWATHGTCT